MEKFNETWGPTGIVSSFKITLQDSTPGFHRPAPVGAGILYTPLCGFGWRFSFRIDQQSAPAVVVDSAGNNVDSFKIQLFFDPHLVKSGSYGVVSFTIQTEHLMADPSSAGDKPIQHSLPNGSTNLSLASSVLPRTLEPRMAGALEDTLTGKELVDVKFYAFSRRGADGVTHPLPLFAKTSLLRGFSDDLNAMLDGHGFSESAIVDLDKHQAEQDRFTEYGYESDSDLDSDQETDEMELIPTSETKDKVKPGLGVRNGRVLVLKDTAFKTWKALLYFLYTGRVHFCTLKSQEPQESVVVGPTCSPKSMYRLADKVNLPVSTLIQLFDSSKLGLEDLQALALASISSHLSEQNILQEVFSSFTSVYPAIQELQVGILVSNFSDKATEGLDEMTKKICEGEKPYCADTLLMLIRKMGPPKK
ncbi:hypothetical protein FB45DRAFT_1036982 [Roridomyces roridus]|uniref:BTB domain-containing protein n=1 Tax=Roridomyces roridus TaxID=1738132 RepID=A0AAD7B797_9AGAR|nr:hypothetical protein FB45DRAFT_1036982 [Roridomyces roridus]